jgi:hypothetical protein
MALAAYNFHIQDTAGNDVTGAELTVRDESDASMPQLYGDRDGLSALGNPFTSANASGRFHVVGGAYKIEARIGGNLVAEPLRYVAVGTAGERDAEDVTAASSGVFSVDSYGADSSGATDSTSAINAAAAALIAATSTTGGILEFSAGTYSVSTIDFTGIANFPGGMVIRGKGRRATLIRGIHQSSSRPIFDCTGSSGVSIRDLTIAGQESDGDAPATVPSQGILFAEEAAGSSNVNFVENCTILGYFTRAAIEFYGCTNSGIAKTDLQNYQATAIGRAIHVNGDADDKPTSSYVTVNASNPASVNELTFNMVECHPRFQGTDGGRAIQLSSADSSTKNVNNINFFGCLVDCSAASEAHVYITGYVRNVGFYGCKFYSEGGSASEHFLEVPSGNFLDSITFSNCQWSIPSPQTAAFQGTGSGVLNGRMIGCGPVVNMTGPELVNFAEPFPVVGGPAINLAGDVTKYLCMGTSDTNESNARMPMIRAGLVVGLRIKTGGSPGGGQSYVITVRKNGAATSVTATVSDGNTTASDLTHVASFNVGDDVSVEANPSGTASNTGSVYASLGFIPA